MRAVIQFHADLDGTTPNKILGSLLGSELNLEHNRTYSPVTGKAAKDSSGNSGSGENSSDGLKLDAATALIFGKGYKSEIELNPGSSYSIKAQGRFSEF